MSFALPARQVTFGRSHVHQQPYQAQQQAQPSHGLALPSSSGTYLGGSSGLALPGPSPLSNSFQPPQPPTQPPSQSQPAQTQVQQQPQASTSAAAIPSAAPAPATPPVPATPIPLTLEQQHITAVEGIVPTLQNIVATVNLDCRLDLKTIALHARNAEYNPKVGSLCSVHACRTSHVRHRVAFCSRHHANSRPKDDCTHLRIWQDGRDGRQVGR